MIRTAILATDLKNMFRDKALWIILALPLFLVAFLNFAVPQIEVYLPEIREYYPLIVAFFAVLASTMSGFLMAFVMLDEKDQELYEVFNVTPLRFRGLITYRIRTMIILGFTFSLTVLLFNGLISLSPAIVLLASAGCALAAPVTSLAIVGMASNKIEGVTYYKLSSMVIILPVVGMFIQTPLRYLFGIFPYFWIFLGLHEKPDGLSGIIYFSVCLLEMGFYLALIKKLFARKYF